jgi:hypothetical protein
MDDDTQRQREELTRLAHELADTAVNWGGYSDDPVESDARSIEREALEERLLALALQHV